MIINLIEMVGYILLSVYIIVHILQHCSYQSILVLFKFCCENENLQVRNIMTHTIIIIASCKSTYRYTHTFITHTLIIGIC